MAGDQMRLRESAKVKKTEAIEPNDAIKWRCKWELRKFHGDSTSPDALYDIIRREGNLLVYGGASALWNRLTEATPAVNAFDDASAHIGVGNGTAATVAADTDLKGASKFRKVVDGVTHTDSATASDAANVTFVATYATTEANFAWEEWGIFNAASAGRMLNRKVEPLGTKTSAATWQLTITLTLGGGS